MAEKVQGAWWNWCYKDALKTKSEAPAFTLQGRKQWFGLSRQTFNSATALTQAKSSCLVFFPQVDHTVDSFSTSLAGAFKTAVR